MPILALLILWIATMVASSITQASKESHPRWKLILVWIGTWGSVLLLALILGAASKPPKK